MESSVPIVESAPEDAIENPICIIGFEEPSPELAGGKGFTAPGNQGEGWKQKPHNGHKFRDKAARESGTLDPGSGSDGGKAGEMRPLPKWSKKEDVVLLNFVKENGKAGWARVGRMLGRTGKQCRNRFYNALDPELSAKEWTAEEDRCMVELHKRFGCRWAILARHLPGRGQNTIKNHWNCVARTCKDTSTSAKKFAPSPLRAYIASLKPSLENRGESDKGVISSQPGAPSDMEESDKPLPLTALPGGPEIAIAQAGEDPGETGDPPRLRMPIVSDGKPPVALTLDNVIEEGPTAKLARKLGAENDGPVIPLKKQRSESPERGRGETPLGGASKRSHSAGTVWRLDQISQWITEWAKPGDVPRGGSPVPVQERGGFQDPQVGTPRMRATSSGSPQAGSLDSTRKRDRGVIDFGENESGERPAESGGHFDWKAQLLAQWTSSRSGGSPEQTAFHLTETGGSTPVTIPLQKQGRGSAFVATGGAAKRKTRQGGEGHSPRAGGLVVSDLPLDEIDASGGSSGSGNSAEENFDWKAQWAILNARHPGPGGGAEQQLPRGGVRWEDMVSGVPPGLLARYASADVSEPGWLRAAIGKSASEASSGGAGRDESEAPLSEGLVAQGVANTQFSPPLDGSFTALLKEVSDTIRRPPAGATRVQAHKPQASGEGGELLRSFGSPPTSAGFGGTDSHLFGGDNSFFRWTVGSPLSEKQFLRSASENESRGEPSAFVLQSSPPDETPLDPEQTPHPCEELLPARQSLESGSAGRGPGGLYLGHEPPPQEPRASWGAGAESGQHSPPRKASVANPALTKLVTEHLCSLLDQQAKQFNAVDPANPTRLDPDQVVKLREQHVQMRAAIAFLSTLTRSGTPVLPYEEGDNREGFGASVADGSVSLVSPSTPDSASSPIRTPYTEGGGKRPRRGGLLGGAMGGHSGKPVDVGPMQGLRLEEPGVGGGGEQATEGGGWNELPDDMGDSGDRLEETNASGAGLKQGDRMPGWVGLEDPKAPERIEPVGNGAEWHQWLAQQVPPGQVPLPGDSAGGPDATTAGADVAVREAKEQSSHSAGHRSPSGASSDVEQRFAQCFLTWPDENQT
ncbi:myb proto-oncogene protein [Klebsormidium nitens]|uniref:Myb proto-oncogene protein n=1 Tax=Klebsormidium nitens TaxID=105231 RepID=A0A1Y1HXT6_KLENI|nr:myb proto-oncogene protein [Klebsormidium nitens]|eukprot:GAQ83474.1 myb proto-oncogene protein [Klebsormidium nitens]